MQVTLVSTTETLDVVRKLPDGTTEEVGSYQVAISDPAFVAKAEELVREQGFTLDDVPPVETMVKLALTGNMSTGGIWLR